MTLLPKVKLKAAVNFPATVLGGAGIDVTKSYGTYRFDLGFGDFTPPVAALVDPPHQNVLLWNNVTGQYALAPAAVISGSGPPGPVGPAGPAGPPGSSGTGSGNVTGPVGAVADRIAVYNGVSGTVIKDGGQIIANLAPTVTTTRGDIITRGVSIDQRLALGLNASLLGSNGTDPVWTGFTQAGTGAASQGWQNKIRERVSIIDFKLGGDTWAQALTKAVNYVQSLGGGCVFIPAGIYSMANVVTITPAVSGFQNVILEGDSRGGTILDFSTAPAGTDGLAFTGWGGRFGIENLTVQYAKRYGININAGEVRGGPNYISRIYIRNVLVQSCVSDGIRMVQTYVGSFRDIESRANGGKGFNLQGTHTSLTFTACWAGGDALAQGNTGEGWFINGLLYSNFIGCASDWNSLGYLIKNCNSVTFQSCGSESNSQEGMLIQTATDGDSTSVASPNIRGVAINQCFAYNNGGAALGAYANAVGISTANSRDAVVSIRGFTDQQTNGNPLSLAIVGTSGRAEVYLDDNSFVSSTVRSGTTTVNNRSVLGKQTVVSLAGNQSIPNVTDTQINFATLNSNLLGCTVSGGSVILPSGINRVKVTANLYWDTNSTGYRFMTFTKTGAAAPGAAAQQKITPNGFTQQNLTSAVFDVAAGDQIGVSVNQSSGGALNVVNNGATFLSVEGMG